MLLCFLVLQPFLRCSCGRPHSPHTTQRKIAIVVYRERASGGSSLVTANPVPFLSYQEDTQPLTTWGRVVIWEVPLLLSVDSTSAACLATQNKEHAILPPKFVFDCAIPSWVSVCCVDFFWGDVNKYFFTPDRAMRKKKEIIHIPIWQTNGFNSAHWACMGEGLLMFFHHLSSCTWICWYFNYCLWPHALQSVPTSHSGCGLESPPISQYVGLKLSLGHSNYQ